MPGYILSRTRMSERMAVLAPARLYVIVRCIDGGCNAARCRFAPTPCTGCHTAASTSLSAAGSDRVAQPWDCSLCTTPLSPRFERLPQAVSPRLNQVVVWQLSAHDKVCFPF